MLEKNKRLRFGAGMQKVLLLLEAGAALSLTGNPRIHFRIVKGAAREWQKIKQRTLMDAIRRLYQSKLVDFKENTDGSISLILTEGGKKKVLRYRLNDLRIKKPARWDGLWRMVVFDIPESNKQGRNALALKLKQLGFYPLQKSVFVYPYECKDEIDFITEIFELRPYVRFIKIKEIDVDLELKHRFGLM
jgi:CRISPR-associated endonuclease Cas2